MVSPTSGSHTFNLDVDELLEEALDKLGGEHTSGIDAEKARRKLNLVLIQMQNKQIPLSKLAFVDQAITAGTTAYTLDGSISDVLQCTLELDDNTTALSRYGVKDYHRIPNKTTTGRPTVFFTERLRNDVTVNFWPVPNLSTYTAKLLVSKRIEDVTASYQKLDIPVRYLPLLEKWLAYEIALSIPGFPADQKALLKAEYLEAMPDTFEEDRERVDFRIRPGGISGR